MTLDNAKPLVFISYSHKDDPDQFLTAGAWSWLEYVKSHLEVAVAQNQFKILG